MAEYIPTDSDLALPAGLIDNSYGVMAEAAVQASGDIGQTLYTPEVSTVPRPDFDSFVGGAQALAEQHQQAALEVRRGRLVVPSNRAEVLQHFDGLRGLAAVLLPAADGTARKLIGPAIVLPGATQLAVLVAEKPAAGLSPTQQALLETEYLKHAAKVAAEHNPNDVPDAGAIGPALVVVSSHRDANPHGDLHGLGPQPGATSFGKNFSHSGRQDFIVSDRSGTSQTRHVRSAVVPVSQAIFMAGKFDQPAPEAQLAGTMALSAGELAVGMTLAASETKGLAMDLRSSIIQVTESAPL